jgi:hypothetical protein
VYLGLFFVSPLFFSQSPFCLNSLLSGPYLVRAVTRSKSRGVVVTKEREEKQKEENSKSRRSELPARIETGIRKKEDGE